MGWVNQRRLLQLAAALVLLVLLSVAFLYWQAARWADDDPPWAVPPAVWVEIEAPPTNGETYEGVVIAGTQPGAEDLNGSWRENEAGTVDRATLVVVGWREIDLAEHLAALLTGTPAEGKWISLYEPTEETQTSGSVTWRKLVRKR